MSTLADIIRTLKPNATRNEIKVARARLRRMGLTNVNPGTSGAYTVNTSTDDVTDARCSVGGTVIVSAVAA